MSSLDIADMRFLESALEMGGGYCLDFSDRTYADFFFQTLNIDIDAEEYRLEGGSKGKRMRFFLRTQPDHIVARLLHALQEYRSEMHERTGRSDNEAFAARFAAIITRLSASPMPLATDPIERFSPDVTLDELAAAIQRDVNAGSAETALDRLHTYCMKKFAYLIRVGDPGMKPAATLHARLGQYLGTRRKAAKEHHPVSFKIMTAAVEAFELYNSVRNDRSLAHDNTLIERAEARFIFDGIMNVLRFLKATEGAVFDQPPPSAIVAVPSMVTDINDEIPF